MGLPRIRARGFPSKREEANRAGMIPTTLLRNLLERRRRKKCTPAEAAIATPRTARWEIHTLDPGDDDESGELEQIAMAESRGEGTRTGGKPRSPPSSFPDPSVGERDESNIFLSQHTFFLHFPIFSGNEIGNNLWICL